MKNPQDIYKSLVTAGDQMAEDAYNYRLLDDSTKSILAQLTIEAKAVEGVTSMAEAKDIACSSSSYRDHLKACAEASREAERSKIRYFAARTYADHCRTAESSHRAAMTSGAAT